MKTHTQRYRTESQVSHCHRMRGKHLLPTGVMLSLMMFVSMLVMSATPATMLPQASAQTLMDMTATMGVAGEMDAKSAANAAKAKKSATNSINTITGQNAQSAQAAAQSADPAVNAAATLAASANATRPNISVDPAPVRGEARTMLITGVLVVGVVVASIMSSRRHLDN